MKLPRTNKQERSTRGDSERGEKVGEIKKLRRNGKKVRELERKGEEERERERQWRRRREEKVRDNIRGRYR